MNNNNRYRFVVFINIILVRFCIGILWASAGPLLPMMIEEFGYSRSVVGWFASIAPLTIAAVSIPVNSLVHRLGLKRLFTLGALLLGVGILSFFMKSFVAILAFRICFAIGTAVIIPVATAITAEWFSTRELPLLNGVGMSLVNIGNGLAFLATVPLANWLSWNAPLGIYAAFALIFAVSWIFLGKEKPEEPVDVTTGLPNILEKRPDIGFKQILKNRVAILMTISVTVSWALTNSFNAWLPDFYYTVFGIPLNEASSILSIYTICATVSAILGGYISTRLGRRKPLIMISGLVTGVAALFSILFNIPVVIMISVGVFGFFFGLPISSLFTIPMEIPNMSVRSGVMVIAMMQVGGNLGNFLSPLLVGILVDATGSYYTGFIPFVILSFGLLISGFLLPETGPGAKKPAEEAIAG